MSKSTIVSIGAAVQDVFLQDKLFAAHREDRGKFQELAVGSKNNIADVTVTTGGGASNAAVTFARHGYVSYFMGRLGKDVAAKVVLEDLHQEQVHTSLVAYSKDKHTGYSTILLAPNGERTILTYRGASEEYNLHIDDFKNMKPGWFYISSLTGDMASLKVILAYARRHDIKVAINPGGGELREHHQLRELLPYISILSVNKEEAQRLFEGTTSEELVRQAAKHVPAVIVTDGPKGSTAAANGKIYKTGMYEDVKVVDRAGAGDAFSSGFVAVLAQGGTMVKAMTFASANSTSVVTKIGAKAGILHQNSHVHSMPVTITNL
jgi:ribokinase